MDRNIKDQHRKRDMLLHYAGEAVFDIFETLSSPGDAKTYEALENLAGYFAPKRYADFDTFILNSRCPAESPFPPAVEGRRIN